MGNLGFRILSVGLLAVMFVVVARSGLSQRGPSDGELIEITTDEVFIPFGFDDNDEIVLMLDGFLPNSCYQLTRPEVYFDRETSQVRVAAVARYFEAPCVQALVPFSQEVNIGMLPIGDYEVSSNNGGLKRSLTVVEANNAGPDDFLYAPVESISIDKDQDGNLVAVVAGRFTNTCMSMLEVRLLHQAAEKTVALLPIMDMSSGEDCAPEQRKFREVVPLPQDLSDDRHLLHVRSLNGKAVNLLFSKH